MRCTTSVSRSRTTARWAPPGRISSSSCGPRRRRSTRRTSTRFPNYCRATNDRRRETAVVRFPNQMKALVSVIALTVLAARGGSPAAFGATPDLHHGLLGAVLAAQDRTPAAPSFKAGVELVRLDVRVTDVEGRPIRDLRQDEVEVIENGDSRPVVLFQHIEEPL